MRIINFISYKNILLFSFILFLASCNKPGGDSPIVEEGNYAVSGTVGTGNNIQSLILETKSLSEGKLSTIGNGTDITAKGITFRNSVIKGGLIYKVGGDRFGIYRLTGGKLETIKEAPNMAEWGDYVASQWIDDKTLLLTNGYKTYTSVEYLILNTGTLQIVQAGTLPIPAPPTADDFLYHGGNRVRDGKLYVSYIYGYSDGTVEDSSRLAVMDYPAMTNVRLSADARCKFADTSDGEVSGLFEDESGDMYLMAGQFGTNTVSGILRIRKGSDGFDPSYFFNTSALLGGSNQAGLWYMGNGKAITKSIPADFDFEHPVSSYSVIDVRNQTASGIAIPSSPINPFRSDVLVESNYISIGSLTDLFVYQYNPITNQANKGLQLDGLNSIDRLSKL